MNTEDLLSELEREPFIPLPLHLSDGRKMEVPNPDVAMISRGSVYIFKVRREGSRMADDTQLISLGHIFSVEQLSPAE